MFPNGLWGFLVVGVDGQVKGLGSGGGGGGTWGSITGTLSAQTDLLAALAARSEPLTNGDPVNPEIVFDSFGDVVMVT